MAKDGWRDGVKKEGPGKFLVRITWHDGAGKRHDTERVVYVATRNEALQERANLAKTLVQTTTGWTVDDSLARLLPTLRAGTRRSWTSMANTVRPVFGTRALGSITSDEIRRFLLALPVGDGAAKNFRTLLSRVWEFARDQGAYVGPNPVNDTKPRRTPRTDEEMLHELENPERRAMVGPEVGAFLNELNADLRPLATTQLLLGCRFGEASALQWPDIEWSTGRVRIVRGQVRGQVVPTKGKRARWGVLGPVGLNVLQAHRERMAELKWQGWETWCFPRPMSGRIRLYDLWSVNTVIRHVHDAQKRLGLDLASRTHALRHTFVTAAATRRLNDAEAELVRSMVGHATAQQHAAYIDPRIAIGRSMEFALVGDKVGDALLSAQNAEENSV